MLTRQHVQRHKKCDGGLADRVLKRQPDLATRMMLEQASFSSNGSHKQSTILQLSLDCIDRGVESITEFVSVRERSMHSEVNQTPVHNILILLHTTVFGRLMTKDATVEVTTEHGDKML